MKKTFYLRLEVLAVCAAAMLSCEKSVEIKEQAPEEFYAEMLGSDPEDGSATRTVTVDGKKVLWCEGDKVSIFRGENINDEYVVKEGFGGKTTTKLVKVDDGNFNAGDETTFDANIALYPYGSVAYSYSVKEEISSEPVHLLEVPIPDVQKYTTSSFAPGAFPMVAVSSNKADNNLAFKNLFGIINIRLKSPNWYYNVKNIVIKGNNNELLSGDAIVKCSYSGTPEVTFVEGRSKDYVKLDCSDGVDLIPGEEETEFWIALPFGNYEKGLTVTVNFSSGKFEKITPPIEIKRSVMTPMAVLELDTEDGELYIPDSRFKNALLDMKATDGETKIVVDMDGDGLLTAKDAKAWNEQYKDKDVEFIVSFKYIESLKGIEYFTSLTGLYCLANEITSLDLSHNTALKKLSCRGNQLVLDLSKIPESLTWLDCSATATKELDLSGHTALEYLNCEQNNMERLDVSLNTALKTLICHENELTDLDVSKNVALNYLNCATNKLTGLDISKNPALTYLNCNYNQMTSINFGDNTVIEELRCQSNQFKELDLSKFSSLYLLDCGYNQMTTLDVSMTALGSGKDSMPLSCRMETLKTLYLKTGWVIKYITVDRYQSFIHENTVIEYKD